MQISKVEFGVTAIESIPLSKDAITELVHRYSIHKFSEPRIPPLAEVRRNIQWLQGLIDKAKREGLSTGLLDSELSLLENRNITLTEINEGNPFLGELALLVGLSGAILYLLSYD